MEDKKDMNQVAPTGKEPYVPMEIEIIRMPQSAVDEYNERNDCLSGRGFSERPDFLEKSPPCCGDRRSTCS